MQNAAQFYSELDEMFANHASADAIETYLLRKLAETNPLQLSILNELMGFYRSRGEHTKNQPIINRALNLANKMQLAGTEAGTTTLINAATSLRAAGDYDRAEKIYTQALNESAETLGTKNRKLAALHNNLSMLYSETGRTHDAIEELNQALEILQNTSTDPERDIDIAATHTNLALAMLQECTKEHTKECSKECSHPNTSTNSKSATLESAFEHASTSVRMYIAGNNENQPHYASALAGFAQVQCARGEYAQAEESYSKALDLIARCYGKDSESYAITAENLRQTRELAEKVTKISEKVSAKLSTKIQESSSQQTENQHTANNNPANNNIKTGMQLAQSYWQTYGKPLLDQPKFARYKIALQQD